MPKLIVTSSVLAPEHARSMISQFYSADTKFGGAAVPRTAHGSNKPRDYELLFTSDFAGAKRLMWMTLEFQNGAELEEWNDYRMRYPASLLGDDHILMAEMIVAAGEVAVTSDFLTAEDILACQKALQQYKTVCQTLSSSSEFPTSFLQGMPMFIKIFGKAA